VTAMQGIQSPLPDTLEKVAIEQEPKSKKKGGKQRKKASGGTRKNPGKENEPASKKRKRGEDADVSIPAPKRGRPSKSETAVETIPAPKRRGRPSKSETATVEIATVETATVDSVRRADRLRNKIPTTRTS
jgi:hypothetical protein